MSFTGRISKTLIVTAALLLSRGQLNAQNVELLLGADLGYRRLTYNERVYDVLLNLNPALKVHFGDKWQFAVQGVIPTINHYGDYYSHLRFGVTTLSKQFAIGENHHFLASAGLFSTNRYGLDLKYLWPVNDWFAVEAQLGLTGYGCMLGGFKNWQFTVPGRVTGLAKARFYIKRWDSEFRLSAGRYAYADWGTRLEFFTHFNFTSVGLYGQYGQGAGLGAGVKIVFMLPWQQGLGGKVFRARLSSNFRLTYDAMADAYSMKMYSTDPEENERTGRFKGVTWGGLEQ